jgi:hypothetical protein
MPQNLPIRGLGAIGVNCDAAPSSLPINAFTRAKNVRFDEGGIVRSPVFRNIKPGLSTGANLITNSADSDFDGTLVNWTNLTTVNSGEYARGYVDGAAATLAASGLTVGKVYNLSFDFGTSMMTGNMPVVSVEMTNSDGDTVRTGPFQYEIAAGNFITFKAVSTSCSIVFSATVASAADYTIDNVVVHETLNPRLCTGTLPDSGHGSVIMVGSDFGIEEYISGSTYTRSGSIAPQVSPDPFTSTSLADRLYINRKTRVPVERATDGTDFSDLAHWDANWKCSSLRSYGDFLLALNMQEDSSHYPTRVRWSDPALANSIPSSWNASDTTKSAGFNDLVQMKSGIVDGAALGNSFIIYSKDQVWLMDFVGGTFIFNFRKLFTEQGLVNQNCVVEVQNSHFCFGTDDIYTHDGSQVSSIADERVKNYIFNSIDTAALDRCFVHHNPSLEEVYFCYKSNDDMAEFTQGDRCNRAAVFNYRNNTWSFIDLPNVSSAALSTVPDATNYVNSVGLAYNTVGGTYHSQNSQFTLHNLFASDSFIPSSSLLYQSSTLYGLDSSEENTLLAFPVDSLATRPPFVQRVGLDLDEIASASGYKVITKMIPQIHTDNVNRDFQFKFGAANYINTQPTYENSSTFNSLTQHKIDSRSSGRYLSYQLDVADFKDFKFMGFELEVTVTGRR